MKKGLKRVDSFEEDEDAEDSFQFPADYEAKSKRYSHLVVFVNGGKGNLFRRIKVGNLFRDSDKAAVLCNNLTLQKRRLSYLVVFDDRTEAMSFCFQKVVNGRIRIMFEIHQMIRESRINHVFCDSSISSTHYQN